MRKVIFVILLIICCGGFVTAQKAADPNRDPEKIKFVTSDIDNFWRAYDIAVKETDKKKWIPIFQKEYFDKGSVGLKNFTLLRIGSAENLVGTIVRLPKFYATLRKPTTQIAAKEKRLRAAARKFKKIYPDAVFPDVYFLIGIASSGGTTFNNGLLIGSEMYGLTPETPQDELPPWLRSVLASGDKLPAIVSHESCHFNQHYGAVTTLLAKAILEGSCDFIGEMVSSDNINMRQRVYGDAHEAELWKEFETDMLRADYSKWIYNGSSSKDRPGDLGYYVGYKICEAYYKRAKDKRQAVRDLLEIKDFETFLQASGYQAKFGSESKADAVPPPAA